MKTVLTGALEMKDKHIIISGGSSGIGLVLAEKLGKRGARLSLVARSPEKLEDVRARLESSGAVVKVFSCDVSDKSSVEETMARITSEQGPPDWLINSAGALAGNYFENFAAEDFHRLMDINFYGTLYMTQAALPGIKKKGGRIVNISSMAGVKGIFGYTSYCASKHAVAGLTHALRAELKPQRVHVHLVVPPEAETPMLEEVRKDRPPETKAVAETIPALPAEKVAEKIVADVHKDRYLIVPGTRTRALLYIGNLFPAMERMLMDFLVRKTYQGPRTPDTSGKE